MKAYVRRIARMCCAYMSPATNTVNISAKLEHCENSFAKSNIKNLPQREI
jgi:CBS-domain-containing membrane protein